jgi:hypothetical protein
MHHFPAKRAVSGLIAGLCAAAAAGAGALVISTTALAATPPFPQCPRIGWDTSCAILIVINPDNSVTTFSDPGQGPFDGVEDSLIGVQNNSGFGIKSMDLVGPGTFGFDADGLCSGVASGPSSTVGNMGPGTFYPPPRGCQFGPTGYEGPGTSFSNFTTASCFGSPPPSVCGDPAASSGTVNFAGPHGLAAGSSTYFSLETKVTTTGLVVRIDPSIVASGQNISATEGVTFSGAVATFTDPDPGSTALEYSATIDWGDATPTSVGTISGSGGSFTVSGSHLYAEESSSRAVTVTITDNDNPANTDVANSNARVGDAALASRCATPPVIPQSYAGPTATFADQSSTGTLSDFSATIDWGDSSSSPGTITGGPGNADYFVAGSHTYASSGAFTITTTINDVGGSTTKATCSNVAVFVFATSKGASFVVGDLTIPPANTSLNAYFWGSQWDQMNPMSGAGPSPSSFKGFSGFEDNPLGLPPVCGGNWTTDTGNATPPPPGPLPPFMAVIVSSNVTQNGSIISGDIEHIVVVKTNPGYSPNPGNPGTGMIIGVVC